jgi:chaperone modulatory protein CbpM
MQRKVMQSSHAPQLDAGQYLTCEQLSGHCGLSMIEIGELVGYSALEPIASQSVQADIDKRDRWVFSANWLRPLQAAAKLRNDFDLDMFSVAVVLSGLQRIDELEQLVRFMQQEMLRMVPKDTPSAGSVRAAHSVHAAGELMREDRSRFTLFKQNNLRRLHG